MVRISDSEIRRRVEYFHNYVSTHSNISREEVMSDTNITYVSNRFYFGKIYVGIFDSIVKNRDVSDMDPEEFSPFLSYIVSMRERFLERSGVQKPDHDDIMSEGILGIIDAQLNCDDSLHLRDKSKYFLRRVLNKIDIYMRYYLSPLSIPENFFKNQSLIKLHRYGIDIEEAEQFKNLYLSSNFPSKETCDKAQKAFLPEMEDSFFTLREDVESEVESRDFENYILDILERSLTERQFYVIRNLFWGLKTTKEMAKEIGTTKQNIQQIKEYGINKLRRLFKESWKNFNEWI